MFICGLISLREAYALSYMSSKCYILIKPNLNDLLLGLAPGAFIPWAGLGDVGLTGRVGPDFSRIFDDVMVEKYLAVDYGHQAGLGQADGKDLFAFLFREEFKGNLFELRVVIKLRIFAVSDFNKLLIAGLIKTEQPGRQDSNGRLIPGHLPLAFERFVRHIIASSSNKGKRSLWEYFIDPLLPFGVVRVVLESLRKPKGDGLEFVF